ncbi:MAG: hypothetical protein H7322_04170 [Ramlibacter sp.]|nr:hypothetical protein [Ramlibacter sp.]
MVAYTARGPTNARRAPASQQGLDLGQATCLGGEMLMGKVAHASVTFDGKNAAVGHHGTARAGVIDAQVGGFC